MRMVGGADDYGIDILLLEQLSKIIVGFGVRKFLFHRRQKVVIDVAERDDVFLFDASNVRARAVSGADDGDVKLFISGKFSRGRGRAASQTGSGGRQGRGLQELAAGKGSIHSLGQ